MDPKKVWGVIIIVLGVIYIHTGIYGYFFTSYVEKEILSMSESMNNMFKTTSDKSYNRHHGKTHSDISLNNAKIWCFLEFLLGISFSVFGTILLKRTNAIPIEPKEKNFNEPIMNLNVTEKNKEDERKWMPPEMRREL